MYRKLALVFVISVLRKKHIYFISKTPFNVLVFVVLLLLLFLWLFWFVFMSIYFQHSVSDISVCKLDALCALPSIGRIGGGGGGGGGGRRRGDAEEMHL